jgi:hypothetical protein
MQITKLMPYTCSYYGDRDAVSTIYFGESIDAAGSEYRFQADIAGAVSHVEVTHRTDEGVRWPVHPPPTELTDVVKRAFLKKSH